MSTAAEKPDLTEQSVRSLMLDQYGIVASTLNALPGERDQNYLVTTGGNEKFVIKISATSESRGFLEAQNQVLERLAPQAPFVPRIVRTISGELHGEASTEHGDCCLRLVSYLPGQPLAKIGFHSRSLLRDLGSKLADIDAALQGFDHPALHREFDWDLQHGLGVIRRHVDGIVDAEVANNVRAILADMEPRLQTLAQKLRCGPVHNDANDYNVIVSNVRDENGQRHVAGIIDFGDMSWSYLAAEPAVACAYLIFRKDNSLEDACHVIAAYHERFPLTEAEIAAMFDLIRLRLCVSACMAAHQLLMCPDNEYLSISQAPIRRALPWLATMPARLAESYIRDACGLPAHPHSVAVGSWLERTETFPVMGQPLTPENTSVLDLSFGSELVADCIQRSQVETLNEQLAAMSVGDAESDQRPYLLGRYAEARPIYLADYFATGDSPLANRRTIHLGLDVFAPSGTRIYSPFDAQVACVQINSKPQDYGTVVVLEHEYVGEDPTAPTRFYSLYGHLDRATADALSLGQRLQAGEAFAALGRFEENGNWAPHLHLQVFVDGFDRADSKGGSSDESLGDLPGVAFPDQRRVWTSICPNPAALLQLAPALRDECTPPVADVLQERRSRSGANLRLSYRQPLHMVRGWMQYLFDAAGRRFLDAYNNVPHVGHCHPRVVDAATKQMRLLNTNTRYLSELFNEYARRLCEKFPSGLDVCYLLNSASEANELAIRLARSATGRHGIVVQEAAYHGHTSGLIEISPYKHNGPGGSGPPDWVTTLPVPDIYRGRFRGSEEEAGEQYALHAEQTIAELPSAGQAPCAFIAETCPSVAGQILPPQAYLSRVYQAIRNIGALCIADEVQTGFGRLGTHFWGFERYGVVPDIVVLGKPIGNAHPLAAVVTTREIADRFANGMEFFSTFGGNNVSCAVGLAVLDTIQDEQLQQRALETGNILQAGFEDLKRRHAVIGDVRGSGLFWGLELVSCREQRTPSKALATLISNRMRDHQILIGTDGPDDNVLKIRPPMAIEATNAVTLLEVLGTILDQEFLPLVS